MYLCHSQVAVLQRIEEITDTVNNIINIYLKLCLRKPDLFSWEFWWTFWSIIRKDSFHGCQLGISFQAEIFSPEIEIFNETNCRTKRNYRQKTKRRILEFYYQSLCDPKKATILVNRDLKRKVLIFFSISYGKSQ